MSKIAVTLELLAFRTTRDGKGILEGIMAGGGGGGGGGALTATLGGGGVTSPLCVFDLSHEHPPWQPCRCVCETKASPGQLRIEVALSSSVPADLRSSNNSSNRAICTGSHELSLTPSTGSGGGSSSNDQDIVLTAVDASMEVECVATLRVSCHSEGKDNGTAPVPRPPPRPKTTPSSATGRRSLASSDSHCRRALRVVRVVGVGETAADAVTRAEAASLVVCDAASLTSISRIPITSGAPRPDQPTTVIGDAVTSVRLELHGAQNSISIAGGGADVASSAAAATVLVPHRSEETTVPLLTSTGEVFAQAVIIWVVCGDGDGDGKASGKAPVGQQSRFRSPRSAGKRKQHPSPRRRPPSGEERDAGAVGTTRVAVLDAMCDGGSRERKDDDDDDDSAPFEVVLLGAASRVELLRVRGSELSGCSEGAAAHTRTLVARQNAVSVELRRGDTVLGACDLIVPPPAELPSGPGGQEVRVQVLGEGGASAGHVTLRFSHHAGETAPQKSSPARRVEPAMSFKPKKEEKKWVPKLTTNFQCSERLLKPLLRGPFDDVASANADASPGKKAKKIAGCSPRLAGTAPLKEFADLPPLVEAKVLPKEEIERHLDRIYSKALQRRETARAELERKYAPMASPRTSSPDAIEERVSRLYKSDMEQIQRRRERLENKYLHRHEPRTKRLDAASQSQCVTRCYVEGMQQLQQEHAKLANKYLAPAQSSPRRTESQWTATVSRLTTPK